MVRAMSPGLVTRKLCLVTGYVIPEMSASWNPSVPIRLVETLAGDRHHRDRVHVGVGQRGDQVGGAGAAGRHADAGTPGGLGVAGRGVPGTLLVADEDVPDLLGVEQRVIRGQHRPAGDAEHYLDAHPPPSPARGLAPR